MTFWIPLALAFNVEEANRVPESGSCYSKVNVKILGRRVEKKKPDVLGRRRERALECDFTLDLGREFSTSKINSLRESESVGVEYFKVGEVLARLIWVLHAGC
jgi:hypothetical protein